jgi:predicted O-methyltransferase YrrM
MVLANAQQDVYQFLLKNHLHPQIAMLAEQIEGRQKAKHKLPHWFKSDKVVFPPRISMEQCSSELTAIFKASLVKGDSLVDLTGGFGVDDWAFAQQFKEVVYLEQQMHLAELAKHNFEQLGCENVKVVMEDSMVFIENTTQQFDCIYLDPARRKETQKVYKLADCEPNVENILPLLWQKTNQILLKCSPLLDIDLAAKSLNHLTKVIVVAVENECKELLFLLQKNEEKSFEIEAVNLKLNGETNRFVYQKKEEEIATPTYGNPLVFLFEPNAAILKSGAFKIIALKFNLLKLHPNSHLYTASMPCDDFPGRKFKISACLPFSKNQIKKMKLPLKANITTRNFPYSTTELRKMTHIKDGGDIYLFFTTLMDGSLAVLVAEKQ